jgi:OOP family OmpA-OmpF porin
MMSKTFLLLVFLCVTSLSFGQTVDSVITAQGRVINAETKEPVAARITYQSLPYGNKVGVINNSTYSFPMFDRERYSIMVEAPGFASAKYMLDPAEAKEQKLVKDIELVHGTAVVKKKHEVGHVMRLDNLIFQISKAKIEPESYPELDIVVNMMKEHPKMVIQLEGTHRLSWRPRKKSKIITATCRCCEGLPGIERCQ